MYCKQTFLSQLVEIQTVRGNTLCTYVGFTFAVFFQMIFTLNSIAIKCTCIS